MSRIEHKFKELNQTGKAALIAFLTAGDPRVDLTVDLCLKLEESGADIIELGVPFSDPMADGPTIQAASERSHRGGTTMSDVLSIIAKIRVRSEIPIITFGYYNPFFAYGHGEFAADAAGAGADGLLVVDLPPEEAEEFKSHTDKAGLDFIFLLAPTSTEERIALVAQKASGFIYLVSVTGVTGARPALDFSLEALTNKIRAYSGLPVGVGFGVSTPEQAEKISRFADAVIVGSALVNIIEKHSSVERVLLCKVGEFIKGLSCGCYKSESTKN
ncbi:MAG: tryptophan synthase subunit alpha [Candidatus Dadabacteria bacterium]|nr:tryptophan synthase subunit alpha [Candidatus Dadabacteria bacterium]